MSFTLENIETYWRRFALPVISIAVASQIVLGNLEDKINDVELKPAEIAREIDPDAHKRIFLALGGNYELEVPEEGLGERLDNIRDLPLAEKAYFDLTDKFPLVFEAAEKAADLLGIPTHLGYALVTQESGITINYQRGNFENGVELKFESQAKARGPWGIAKITFDEYKKHNPDNILTWDDMFGYGESTEVFAWNFKKCMDRYDGKLHLALLCHNSGGQNVNDLTENYGTSFPAIFEALDKAVNRGTENSPKYREVRDFVGSVLGHWRYFHNVFKTIGEKINNLDMFANYLSDTKTYPNINDRKIGENMTITPYLRVPFGYNKA